MSREVCGMLHAFVVYFKVSSLFTLGAAMAAPKMVPYSVHNIALISKAVEPGAQLTQEGVRHTPSAYMVNVVVPCLEYRGRPVSGPG